jgi:hypothetical protein
MLKFVECPNLTENALHIAKHSINPDVGKSHPVEIAFVYANGLGAGGLLMYSLSLL